jgi:hypothetical protein
MTWMCPRRLARVAAPPAVLLAVAACLAGCRGTAVAVSGTSPAAPPVSAAATVSASAAGTSPAQSLATAQGSVTVSVSSPVTDSGTVAVPVSCVAGPGYRATVSSAVIQGDQLSFTADIPRYPGPGSYYAVVAVTFRQSTGTVTAVGHVSRVPAVITADGGSFTVSAVGSGGRTFTGSLRWTCGS